jgi:photosystem II stability/assembly factor-like uncharacterized protein
LGQAQAPGYPGSVTRSICLGVLLLAVASSGVASANGRLPATVNVNTHDSDLILLPSTFGLLVSRDGGSSFHWLCESNIGYGGTFDPDYAISANGDLWASTLRGLRVSRDGGCTWTTQGGAVEGEFVEDVEIGGDGRIWVATGSGGQLNDVFVSTDDGSTFASGGLPEETGWWRSLRIAPSDPDTLYVAGFRPSQTDEEGNMIDPEALLRRTTDGGENWEELAVDDFAFGSQPNLFIAAVSPTDPTVVFARVLGARDPVGDDIYRSVDGGASWTRVLEMQDRINAFLIKSDGQTVIAGTVGNCTGEDPALEKGCVRISTDSGSSFEPAASEPKMACVHETAGGDLLACGANWDPDFFALGRSSDNGATWDKVVRFSEIAGPLSCPQESPQFECAALDWPPLCTQFGICTESDAGVSEPEPEGCLGCNSSGAAALGLLIVLPLAFNRRRR